MNPDKHQGTDTMAIKFEQVSENVFVTKVTKTLVSAVTGKPFRAVEACRAILEHDGWRIDFAGNIGGSWLPWEPITDEVFPTSKKALTAIRKYAVDTQVKK